ncbi:MAG: hypothetical protein PVJ07_09135 [Anaerolineales bacterium]|jgi:hypothetical protein
MKIRLVALSILLGAVILGACSSPAGSEPSEIPCGQQVSWEEAIEILNSGLVKLVAQFHSLEVELLVEDDCVVKTIEPRIDDIFAEVEKCGEPCADIMLATE